MSNSRHIRKFGEVSEAGRLTVDVDQLWRAKEGQKVTTTLTDQRLFDLVRYSRHALFTDGLITNEEYATLVAQSAPGAHGSVARLESYDEVRAKLAQYEAAPPPLHAAVAGYIQFCHQDLDAAANRKILDILQAHCGERGDNEGAIETLQRIVRERDVYFPQQWPNDDPAAR